jgi:hypothetical protein
VKALSLLSLNRAYSLVLEVFREKVKVKDCVKEDLLEAPEAKSCKKFIKNNNINNIIKE